MTGQLPQPGDSQGEQVTAGNDDFLTTMIDQLYRNWDHDDNAANDDVVIRIREHIRRQQEPAAPDGGNIVPRRDEHPVGWEADLDAARRLPKHTQTVADDLGYWSGHGVQVVSIRPRIDGEGAVIGVYRLTNHIATAMQERYAFPVYCWDALPPS